MHILQVAKPEAQTPSRAPGAGHGGAKLAVYLAGLPSCFGGILPCYAPIFMPCSVLSYTESVQLVLLFYRSSWLSFVSGLLKDFGSLNTVEIGLRRLPKLERRQFALRDGHEPTGARGKMLRFKCCVWVSS